MYMLIAKQLTQLVESFHQDKKKLNLDNLISNYCLQAYFYLRTPLCLIKLSKLLLWVGILKHSCRVFGKSWSERLYFLGNQFVKNSREWGPQGFLCHRLAWPKFEFFVLWIVIKEQIITYIRSYYCFCTIKSKRIWIGC